MLVFLLALIFVLFSLGGLLCAHLLAQGLQVTYNAELDVWEQPAFGEGLSKRASLAIFSTYFIGFVLICWLMS